MAEEQRQAAMAIFEAALSKQGYEKIIGIMDADRQALLLDLVREWVGLANDEAAATRMSEIEDNLAGGP